MREPALIPRLIDVYSRPHGDFWLRLFTRNSDFRGGGFTRPRPLVKICDITNREDALAAIELGADVLGFVFADSPRRSDPALLEELADLPALKVGVTVHRRGDRLPSLPVADLLNRGLLDALQLHGEEGPGDCEELRFPWYKAVRLRSGETPASLAGYSCPRVLLDAYVRGLFGGTGRRLHRDMARRAGTGRPLWVAGGLGPENIREVLRDLGPELVDASSGLEAELGRKNHDRLRAFFKEVQGYIQEMLENAGSPDTEADD
jgi:indole-3-glycerol phosphate synthase/phosphoribosylanthranilate isomerase